MTEALARRFPHALLAAACVGIAAANAGRIGAWALAVAAAAGAAAAVVPGRVRLPLLAFVLLLAGWWWGSARLDALDRSVLVPRGGEVGRVTAVVTGPARRSTFAVRVPARVVRFDRLRLSEAVQLELPPGRAPPQGARLELVATVALPERRPEFDERAWLARRGVHVILDGHGWRVTGRRGGIGGVSDRLRARLARTIARGLDGPRRGVVQGIVLGEDEALSDELKDSFRAAGLYHLLAVSGQNVALVVGGVLLLAWLLAIPRLAAEIAALAAVLAYLLAVGWQPSVVRAGVAGALASVAWLAGRQRDRWYFLGLGALVLLAWNPYNLLEPGFQLSFGAVASIFLGVPPLLRALEGYPVPRAVAGVVAVSAACGLATAPILWLHFHALPIYSVPANALAAPAVPPLLGFGLAAAALDPVLPGAAAALAAINGWLAAYLALCARLIAALPYAQVTTPRALLVLVLLPVFAFVALRLRPPRLLRAAALAVMVVAVLVAWRPHAPAARAAPDALRLTFLDVGQGDACLVEAPGVAILVDQGPPEAHVADQLRALGVRRLTGLVFTHPQRDHVGGAAEVLAELAVGFVLDPRLPVANPDHRAAVTELRERRVPHVLARAGATYRFGRLRLSLLWPDSPGPRGDDPNLHATVIVVSYGEVDALLTADAESDVVVPLQPPPVEILKVAHHGSADARLPDLLDQIRPRVAVISVGEQNDYGHPTPSTVAVLEREPGLRVLRTDRDGRVTVESDGSRLWVSEER